MGKINGQRKIFLSKASAIAVFLAAILCFTSPPDVHSADDYKLSAQDAGIMAGVAVGIGIIIGHIIRSNKTDDIKSAPTGANDTVKEIYFISEREKKEDIFMGHPLELYVTVFDFKF